MFKPVDVINDDKKALIKTSEQSPINTTTRAVSANQFDETISSVEGVCSKYMYCAKIDQFTDEVKPATLHVLGDRYIHLEKQP